MLVVILAFAVLPFGTPATSAAAGPSDGLKQRRIAALKALDGRPHPLNLGDAQALHTELFRRAGSIARIHGRQLVKAAPVAGLLPAASSSAQPSAQCAARVWQLCGQSALSGQGSAPCDVCAGLQQHSLRDVGCSAADIEQLCDPAAAGATLSPLISPVLFGADPTGVRDSTLSVLAAVQAVLNCSESRGSHHMASPVKDLGGATLDLLGGTYLISAPLVFPAGYGNFQVVRGTIRASGTFPPDRFLVEIGSDNPHNYRNATDFCYPGEHQGICNEFVNLSELFLDASHVAAGGLSVSKTMGLTFGPSAFVYGFTDTGIRVDSGHEIMILEVWVAEYYWDETTYVNRGRGIGIELNGPDNVMTNVIVFSHTDIGVKVGFTPRSVGPAGGNETAVAEWAGCNILDTVHIWNGGPVQVGLQMDGPRNRLVNSYMDGGFLNVSNPNSLTVTNTLFLNTHSIWNVDGGYEHVQHVHYRDNMYVFEGPSPEYGPQKYNQTSIELRGDFNQKHTLDIVVEDEMHVPQGADVGTVKSTIVRQSLSLTDATRWEFNVSSQLLFPWIDEVIYSFSTDGPIVAHVLRPYNNSHHPTVVVETETVASGTVVVEVRQGVKDYKAPTPPDGGRRR